MASKTTATAAPGRNGFKYQPRYGVIVLCRDEEDQRRKFERLTRLGMETKVVTV